jgi:glycosyltransferase involved in cell wall biosynthesis
MKYSLVIPVFNEEGNVANLHAEIVAAMDALPEEFLGGYEIIFADDGSSDKTVEILKGLSPVTVIELRKNFGQTAAMDAGIKHAVGDVIITLDGDGQNPPSEIVKLLEKMKADNLDIVSGWRKNRKDPFGKRFASRGANMLRGILVKDEIHDSGCSLKVYKRECFEGVDLLGEMHRFIPAVLKWSGFKVGEVEVSHRERTSGVTKYNWKRIVKGLIDMVAIWFWRKYARRPLHLFGGVGVIAGSAGVLIMLLSFIARIFFDYPLSTSIFPLIAMLLMIVGVQLFVSGLLADIAVRQYYRGPEHRPYSIKNVTIT